MRQRGVLGNFIKITSAETAMSALQPSGWDMCCECWASDAKKNKSIKNNRARFLNQPCNLILCIFTWKSEFCKTYLQENMQKIAVQLIRDKQKLNLQNKPVWLGYLSISWSCLKLPQSQKAFKAHCSIAMLRNVLFLKHFMQNIFLSLAFFTWCAFQF